MEHICFNVLLLAPLLLAVAEAALKPNLLLWMADDVSFKEFGFAGGEAATPNLDRLGEEGVNFRKTWATPVCRPSRGMIMSGAFPDATGWWDAPIIPNNIGLNYGTFAHVAKTAGYRTMMVGKFQLKGKVIDHGFDEYCMWEHSDIRSLLEIRQDFVDAGGPFINKTERKTGVQNRFWEPLIVRHDGGTYKHYMYPPDENLFGPHILAECMVDFMARMKAADTPWLIYWPGLTAHQHWDEVLKRQAYIAMPVLDADFNIVGRENEGEGSLKSNIEYMDRLAGYLTDQIEKLGIKDKTVFGFFTDNGTNNYGKKSLASEFGPHIPGIVWGGPVKKRGQVNRLFSLIDWYATIVEWTGGTEGARPNGKDPIPRPNSVSFAKFFEGTNTATNFKFRKWMISWLEDQEYFIRSTNFVLDGNGDFWNCKNNKDERTCFVVDINDPATSASAKRQFNKLSWRLEEIKANGYSNPRKNRNRLRL
mmetsp:Transcript_50392/g.123882  ORF Transcript_50392/g.123882 Transcript_50392/m.123882 type:complete len:477 (-) Transcript_50392:165-1595(-)